MTEPAYIPVKTPEMSRVGLVGRNANRVEKRRTDDTLSQAKAILSRPNAVSSTGQLNPRVVSREEARIVLASGLTDRAPTRLSQARSIQPLEAAGNVMGGVLGEAHRMSQHAAGSLARVAPTPEKENARRIYAEAKKMGMTDEQAARAAWQGINAPWGVKGAIELATDPLNLLPGVGFGGAIARGTGAVARGTGRGLAAGARVLGEPLEEALTGGMRVPGSRVSPMGGRLNIVPPDEIGRPIMPIEKLPKDLSGAKPNYNMGKKQYIPQFESDIDKALFIVSQKKKSKRDAAYMDWLRTQLPDLSDEQIRAAGVDVRAHIKATVKGAPEGDVVIPRSKVVREQTSKSMPPPVPDEAASATTATSARAAGEATVDEVEQLKAMVPIEDSPLVSGWDRQGVYDKLVPYATTMDNALLDTQIKNSTKEVRRLKSEATKKPHLGSNEVSIAMHNLAIRIAKAEKARRASVQATRTSKRAVVGPTTLRAINEAKVTFNVGRKAYNMAFATVEDKALYIAGEKSTKQLGKTPVSQDLALHHLERQGGRSKADLLAEAKQYNREVKQWVRRTKPEPGNTSVPKPQSEQLATHGQRISRDDIVPIWKLVDGSPMETYAGEGMAVIREKAEASGTGKLGPCYQCAHIAARLNEHLGAKFVQGKVKMPGRATKKWHAWVEVGDFVYDESTNLGMMPKSEFYKMLKPEDVMRATSREAEQLYKGVDPKGPYTAKELRDARKTLASSPKAGDTTLGERIDALDESIDDFLHTPGSMGDAEHRLQLDKILKDVGFAANIRLGKYSSDQAAELARWAAEHPDDIEAATRGVVSDEQVLANAKQLVNSVGGDVDALMKRWKAGQAWNAEEITAIRGALADRTQAVANQAAKVAGGDNTGEEVAKLFIAMQRHAAVQKVVHGITSEAGRALRAFRQEASESLFMKDFKMIEKLILRAGGTRAELENYAEAIMEAVLRGPGREQEIAIQQLLEKAYTPSGLEKVMELWINSILSGPKTHIINIISNTANAVTSPFERLGAAFVDNIVAPLQGRQRERFYTEAIRDAAGFAGGIQDGIYAGFRALQLGSNPSAASKYEFRRKAIGGRIGEIVRLPGTLLEAADAMHSTINLSAAKNALAYRSAAKKGLNGADLENEVYELINNPKHAGYYDLHKEALAHAEYRLFRNELGENLQKIMELRQKVPLLRFIMPFMRTPANLLTYGIARSPLAFVPIPLGMLSRSKINIGMWKTLSAKSPEFSDQFARAFLGTMAATMLAFGVAKGRITGATPHTAGARDRFYREGKLPYSIRIGNHWVQYSRLEPFNQVLAQIAAVFPEEGWEDDDDTIASNASKVVFSIGENMVSQTYMSGLSDLIAAIRNPEMYSDAYLGRIASGLVPASSLLRTIAGIQDPTIRKPVKESAFPGTILDRMAMTLPAVPGFEGQKGLGGRTGIQAKLTAFGEETRISRPSVLSPIQFRKAQQSDVDLQLDLLGVEVGFVGNSVGGQKLTSEQHQEYKRIAGQLTLAALRQLIERPGFANMSVERRENLVLDTISGARRRARGQMLRMLRQQGLYQGRGSEVPDTVTARTGIGGAVGSIGDVLFGSSDVGTEGYDPTAHENFGW